MRTLIPLVSAVLVACSTSTPATDVSPAKASPAAIDRPSPEVTILDAGIAPFVEAFNADAGRRRVVIILSPT